MTAKPLTDLDRLCIHTITTKPWKIEEAARHYAAAGVKGITVWRDALEGRDVRQVGNMLRDQGLEIVSLCRGGFFPAQETSLRKKAIDDNKKAIDEAALLGAPLVVLVCGSDPRQSLDDSRKQIHDGIAEIIPHASAAGIRLAIEPLHPMYADTRSAINTLAQANDMAEALNAPAGRQDARWVGVAVDVYHLWWDPDLEKEIKRCGAHQHLLAFHVCDWKVPTTDLLLDRGLMGEGCIPVKKIRTWVEDAGFNGFCEVEIFSNTYWKGDQQQFLEKITEAYRQHT